MAGARVFRLRGSGGVRLHAFDDLVVVFGERDWETHLVDERAARVLRMLASGPCTHEAIERELAAQVEPGAAGVADLTRALLDELAAAGLIEGPIVGAPG